MGRPLGIRSKPYAAINTTDADQDGGGGGGGNNSDLPPISPTIYQGDSGLSFENEDEEGYAGQNYGDEVYEEVYEDDYDDAEEDDGIATQSMDLQHQLDTTESQSNERSFRVKFVLLFSFLAAMVIFGKEYYNSNGDSKIISTEFTTEEYNGVRGKSSPQDNWGGEEGILCQDDPDFIYHNDEKDSQFTCAEYVGSIEKAGLLRSRCRRSTGIRSSEDDTVELMIQDFCKLSCGLCSGSGDEEWGDEFTEEEKEIIKEQIVNEVDEGMLEMAAKVDKLVEEGDVSEINEEEIMDAEEVLAELEADLEEDEEFLIEDHQHIAEKMAAAEADDDGVLADEKKEYISELAEELQEDSEIEEGVEALEEELEVVEEIEEELEEIEELYEDSEVEEDVSEEDSWSAGEDDDIVDYYFTPLTPDERDQMKEKLRNTLLQTKNALRMSASPESRMDVTDTQRTLMLSTSSPKQFMHMHHMKTGGTSVDGLIRCALNRQRELHNGTSINYGRMSECGSGVQSCMKTLATKLDATLSNNIFYRNDEPFDPADESDVSVDDMNVCRSSESNVMSYCASLHAVRTFGWKDVDKITVIRNPIDRAWSMYRFTLTGCYDCQQLKDVLKQILNGTFVSRHGKKDDEEDNKEVVPNFLYEPNDSCAVQLIGHQSTNLLSSVDLYNFANDVSFPMDTDIVNEAIKNLREDFTWIGLTDRIQESVEGFRQIFPFLSENLNNATKVIQEEFQSRGEELEDYTFALPTGYSDEKSCPFQHRNAGHDPTCGTTELDDETKHLIMKLNYRDMAVYKAAVERFELQMEVLQEYKDGEL